MPKLKDKISGKKKSKREDKPSKFKDKLKKASGDDFYLAEESAQIIGSN